MVGGQSFSRNTKLRLLRPRRIALMLIAGAKLREIMRDVRESV
jgi:hypothetical protein